MRTSSHHPWRHVPTPAPLFAQQTLPAPAEGGADDDTAVERREGASIPGGGGNDSSDSDDDLELTLEVDSPEDARDCLLYTSPSPRD